MHITQHGTPGHAGPRSADVRRWLLTPEGAAAAGRVVRLAGLALRAPVSMLGVADGSRLVIVSECGVPDPWRGAGELPRAATFCRHVFSALSPFAVDDAGRHPLGYSVARLDGFPRVAYCGSPLAVDDEVVAVLSVTDSRPRRWTGEDVDVMRDLTAALLREMETPPAAPPVTVATVETAAEAPVQAAPPSIEVSGVDAVMALDAAGRVTTITERARSLFEVAERDAAGLLLWEAFPELHGTEVQALCRRVLAQRNEGEAEAWCPTVGAWLEFRFLAADGGGALVQLRDVTARRAEREARRRTEERYRLLFEESLAPGFVMSEEGIIVEVNLAFAELLGRSREDLDRTPLALIATNDEAFARFRRELHHYGRATDVEVPFRHGSGLDITCLLSGASAPAGGTMLYHGTARDVTLERHAQQALVRSAFHDPLTGLPNRLVFMDRLERVLQHAKRRHNHRFAVLFLDLDNFKQVNDTLGHLVGDQFLNTVARRLESCVRTEDTVARIGGDEFAILLDTITDLASVTLVVERIRSALAEPFTAEGRAAGTSASIGVAVAMNDYERADDLLRDADSAMYRAKAAGRNDYVIFDNDLHERLVGLRQLEADLRDAVRDEQLSVHYQPEVRLDTGGVTGMEALVRWTHPERGILLPAEFMPLAEQTGLIVELGWWVLREACRQLRAWQDEHPNTAVRLTMSVNMSARQFAQPDLVDKLDEILAETGVDPSCLRLDLSEAVVMKDSDAAKNLLHQISDRGINICIDDFGTGYTSVPRLRELPISALKIDRSFVQRIGDQGQGREIVQSIIALGRSMSIDAVAEGVETPEQLDQLRSLGMRFAQGFLFSLPLETAAAAALLRECLAPPGGNGNGRHGNP
jgi:diguanylate cyclase (GGDEF)-like protein/PAS domain S-box-containing protein